MYSLKGIKKGLTHPRFILQELNRLYFRRLHTWSYNENGLDMFEADWDNLLILDACRYDLFEETSELPGETSAVQSRGSATLEFLQGTFADKTLLDTVYVTASPMLYRHRDEINVQFHETIDVWKEQGWDERYQTVLPETVTEAALDAAERYPNKRLLVHFMQPHYPFIGPTGQEHFDLDSLAFQWEDAATGKLDISDDTIRRAYEENFEEVLSSVERLLFQLGGRTVVTADHGQIIGERTFPIPIREYGHPPGIYAEELVKVPWHVFDKGPRREIAAEEPTAGTDRPGEKEGMARDRLRQLGYLE